LIAAIHSADTTICPMVAAPPDTPAITGSGNDIRDGGPLIAKDPCKLAAKVTRSMTAWIFIASARVS
jgi:hypothetical protein